MTSDVLPARAQLPELDIAVEVLSEAAQELSRRAAGMTDAIDSAAATWARLTGLVEIDGTDALFTAIDPARTVTEEYADALTDAASALTAFAETVAMLRKERDILGNRIDGLHLVAGIESGDPGLQATSTLDDQADDVRGAIASLQFRFEQAEDDCATALRTIEGGTGGILPPSDLWPGLPRSGASVSLWAPTAERYKIALADGQVRTLQLLAGFDERRLAQWLEEHPEFTETMTELPPPDDRVSSWWHGLDLPADASGAPQLNADGGLALSSAQLALAWGAAPVIGNLNGVASTARDIANRKLLADAVRDMRRIDARRVALLEEEDILGHNELLVGHGYSAGQLEGAIAAADAVQRTLKRGDGTDVTYQLIGFVPGDPPTAAISVGDMDTATQVTTTVPGMGSGVAASMENWTGAATNLWREQQAFVDLGDAPGETKAAVVSWIGYDAPPNALTTDLSVLYSDDAEVGGRRLAGFLESISATRGWAPGENQSVVAHSYGTTTAAFGLTQTPVENVTFLASAGLDPSIDHVDDLLVDPDRVWASEAEADRVASAGRTVVPIVDPWGRVQFIGSEHWIDPGAATFGAEELTSDEAVGDDGTVSAASTGHSAAPRVEDPNSDQLGYLDRRSAPLRNTAVTSLGMDRSHLVAPR